MYPSLRMPCALRAAAEVLPVRSAVHIGQHIAPVRFSAFFVALKSYPPGSAIKASCINNMVVCAPLDMSRSFIKRYEDSCPASRPSKYHFVRGAQRSIGF